MRKLLEADPSKSSHVDTDYTRPHALLQLFKRMLDQFDRLKKRNAFLEQYKKERMFENGLEEFDDARYVSCYSSCLTIINDPCGH